MCVKPIFDISKIFLKSQNNENDAYGWYNEEQEKPINEEYEKSIKKNNINLSEIEEIIHELEEIKIKLIRYDMKTKKVK